MSNELITPQGVMMPGAAVQQTGKNNVNVENRQGGIVNINYNITNPNSAGGNSAEQMIAIQSFSREYYQLLVTCEEDVFTTNVITVQADRALTQRLVPAEIFERCSTLSPEGVAELKRMPAIICRENTDYNGVTDPMQWAMYAYIKMIRAHGKQIKVVFQPIMPIQQCKLCEKKNAVYFDLNMDCAITDLNHSAWYVHKVNVFEAFKEAGMAVPMPVEVNV